MIFLFLALLSISHSSHAGNCVDLFSKISREQELQTNAMAYFTKHLRLPSLEEMSASTGIPLKDVRSLVPDYESFWAEAMAQNPKKMEDAKTVLILAYNKFMSAQKKGGITPKTATELELFTELLKQSRILQEDAKNGDFEVKHLMRLLGTRGRREGRVPYPVLFDGLETLRLATKEKYPSSFKGMRDIKYGKEYNEETMNLIMNKYNGAIAVSFRGGVPWNKQQFASLLSMAKHRNLVILIKEVNGETDSIPSEFTENPYVRIINHTIDFGNELRIRGSLVVIPTVKNPLAGQMERMQARVRGQKQIVFGTQRALAIVATEKNHITGAHEVWSTGSINEPIYPYSNYASSRVSNLAADRQIPSAVVIEKSDRASGPLGRGAPGRWHITNADFEKGEGTEWGPGHALDFMFYPADGSKPRPIGPTALIPGDYHLGFQDETLLKSFTEQVLNLPQTQQMPEVYMRLHDFQSFEEISHWLGDGERAAMFARGDLDLQAKINLGRATLNDMMMRYPFLRIVLSVTDNHHVWLFKQLDNKDALADPINGPLLTKLRDLRNEGHNVLEYLYKDQKKYDESTPDEAERQRKMSRNIYIEHPENIVVIKSGQPFDVGPQSAPWSLSSHGHLGANGAKAGINQDVHARAHDRGFAGHIHTGVMTGYFINVAMFVRLRSQSYALGGYNGQTNGLGVAYPNGSGQLVSYDPQIGRLYPDLKIGALPANEFLTGEPFVRPDDNDLVEPGVTTLNNYEKKPVE